MSNKTNNNSSELKAFLIELSQNLGNNGDMNSTRRILKTVLHSLRDSIERSESSDFISRLPEWLKKIYEENWVNEESVESIYSFGDFKKKVKEERDKWNYDEFGRNMPVERMTKAVFKTLDKYTLNGQEHTINSAIIIAYCIE